MKHALRSLSLAAALGTGVLVVAQQPYLVTITGTVSGCNANSYVHIVTLGGTQPTTEIDVPVLPPSCTFTVTLNMASQGGGFTISTPCNGAIQSQVVQYQVPPSQDSTGVSVSFNCGGGVADCLGVPGGTALPGTACTTALNQPGIWNANCECVANVPGCQACLNLGPVINPNGNAIPFAVLSGNCSLGAAPITYQINWGDGVVNASGDHAYAAPGTYTVCITIADGSGCTSTACDSVVIDANGTVIVDPSTPYDCLGIANGPNVPGTSCALPNGTPGIWNASCECVPSAANCQAGFWVLQAYEVDSLNPNGGATPIPYELWVWNLSAGTSPFQFLWNFGDGTSSTDPYPTHVYGNSGPYNLCLVMSDAAGCTSTYCDSISIDGDGFYEGLAPGGGEVRTGFTIRVLNQLPMAVPEQRFHEARVWPNPVTDALNLSFRSTVSGSVPVRIIDLNGRVMHQDNLVFARGDNRINLSAAQLAPGLYMLRVGNDDQALNIRFIKQ